MWNAFYYRDLITENIPKGEKIINKGVFNGVLVLTSITVSKRFESQIVAILGYTKNNEGLKIEYTE